MSLSLESVSDAPPGRSSTLARPATLVLLLVTEGLLLTMRFDTPKTFPEGTWWAPVFVHARLIGQWVLVCLAGMALFGGPRLAIRLRREFGRVAPADSSWTGWLVAHGIAVVGFAGLSLFVCEGDLMGSARPDAWFLAWAGSGLALGLTWMGTLLPPPAWLALARRCREVLAMGVAIGVGSLVAARQTSHQWELLAGSTLSLVRWLLGLVPGEVICDPARRVIGLDGFRVNIAPTCSGFEGIGLVWTFLTAYLWWSRRSLRWPRALLLLPLGTATIWLSNAVRIAALVVIGARWSPAVAIGGFHSQAGWLAFLGVSLGLVAVSRRSAFFASRAEGESPEAAGWSNPTAAYLAPLLAIVATTMVTGSFSSGFDALYGLRIATAGLAFWYFRRDLAGLARSASWSGVVIGVAAFALWMAMEPAPGEGARKLASGLASLPTGWAWAWVAARVIGSVAVIPLAEELAFRGYLARRLISDDFESVPMNRFTWASFLISSAAFGLLHGRWLAGGLVGLLYALAMYRRGKLGDAIVAHAVTNALIAAVVLTTGDLSPWA